MKFSTTYLVPAPREKVFALITDPAVLQRCIAGCEKMEAGGQRGLTPCYNVNQRVVAACNRAMSSASE